MPEIVSKTVNMLSDSATPVALFALVNLPFVVMDPRAWLAGVSAPVADPMFPRGAGIILLVVNNVLPLWPPLAYTALEAVCRLCPVDAGMTSNKS